MMMWLMMRLLVDGRTVAKITATVGMRQHQRFLVGRQRIVIVVVGNVLSRFKHRTRSLPNGRQRHNCGGAGMLQQQRLQRLLWLHLWRYLVASDQMLDVDFLENVSGYCGRFVGRCCRRRRRCCCRRRMVGSYRR